MKWKWRFDSGLAPLRPKGFARIGVPVQSVDNGRVVMPAVCPGATPTYAAPTPRSASICVMTPPKEWPMTIGFTGSERMMRS